MPCFDRLLNDEPLQEGNEAVMKTEVTLLRRDEVERRCGLSRPAIYDHMKKGKFPRPVRIGSKAVRWKSSDIDEFISSLKKTG